MQIEKAVDRDGYESYQGVDYVEIVRNWSLRIHEHAPSWKNVKTKVEL